MGISKCLQKELDGFRFSLKESVRKIASQVKQMEKSKYLPPKISPLLSSFCKSLGGQQQQQQEPNICRTLQSSSAKSSNVRITIKNSRAVSKDTAQRKKLYESLKENSPQMEENLEKYDMEELLRNRPALPRRITIPNRRRKIGHAINLYQIEQFDEEEMNTRQSLPQHDVSVSNTPHSITFKSIKAVNSRQEQAGF